jgi:hypothetical protein
MTATKKMLVVTVARTQAVLAAASRQASGVLPAADLVGPGFLARTKDSEETLLVPAADLEVKEVDYRDDVFRTPLAHVVDDQGAIALSPNVVNQVSFASSKVTVQLLPAAAAADKDVVVIVDAGSNRDPLKFVGKTVANAGSVDVPVSGVPPGNHLVLASVAGYNSRVEVLTF